MKWTNILRIGGLVAVAGVLLCSSCKKSDMKSLSELKKEQSRAIDQLISSKSLRIVDLGEGNLPEHPDPAVYYKMSNGLYLCVLSTGTTKAESRQTRVTIEMKGHIFRDTAPSLSTFDSWGKAYIHPTEFRYVDYFGQYGATHYEPIPSPVGVASLDGLMCEGIAYPLSLLGDGAVVSLIIPFELGPSDSYTAGTSMFVERLQYSFVK